MSAVESRPDLVLYGTQGFVARAVRAQLERGRVRIHGVDRPAALEAVLEAAGTDAVLLYCRWRTVPSTSTLRRELEENLGELVTVLEGLARRRPRAVIFLSSAGNLHPQDGTPFDEDAPIRPQNSFGAGKAAAEAVLAAAARELGFGLYVLRAGPLYGPGQPVRAGFGFIAHLLHAAATGAPVPLWDADATRQYLYIDDLVTLLDRALHRLPERGAVIELHAAGPESCSNRDLIARLEAITGRRLNVEERPAPVRLATRGEIACRRAREQFGWRPAIDLTEGLKRTWAAWCAGAPR